MRKTHFAITSTFLASTLAFAASPQKVVEIRNNFVFAPTEGFDDNDMIQLVVDSKLPNVCYKQSKTEYTVDTASKKIEVHQYAELSVTGLCAEQEKLPDELKAVVPFSAEVNLGQLPPGDYKISFLNDEGANVRPLRVDHAPTTTVDSFRYATVINSFVNDYISATDEKIEIRLTLQLNSSCSNISDASKIWVKDNVVVVLPEVVKDPMATCLPVSRAAYKVFTIANPGPGRYLLHTRSLGGNAKNKLFSIVNM